MRRRHHHKGQSFTSLVSREGFPKSIVSNSGPQLILREFIHFVESRGIKNNPIFVSQRESLNIQQNDHDARYALGEKQKLKSAASDCMGIYRCSPHELTGLSFALLFH